MQWVLMENFALLWVILKWLHGSEGVKGGPLCKCDMVWPPKSHATHACFLSGTGVVVSLFWLLCQSNLLKMQTSVIPWNPLYCNILWSCIFMRGLFFYVWISVLCFNFNVSMYICLFTAVISCLSLCAVYLSGLHMNLFSCSTLLCLIFIII